MLWKIVTLAAVINPARWSVRTHARAHPALTNHNTFRIYAQLWRQTRQAWQAARCPPWRCFAATVITIPAFIFFGMAIRQCALADLPGWAVGGSWWFTNLCVPDPLLILPAANATILLCNMFFSIRDDSSPVNTMIKDVLLFLPLAALPLTINLPAAVNVFWITSSTYTAAQARNPEPQSLKPNP